MSTKNTVLVSMMKNESENVLSMLASVEGLYDTFIIGFDSKATDGTKDIVLDYQQSRNRHGIFYEFDWNNDFSEARNNYLNLATERMPEKPWLLIMDGDDLLSPGNPENGIPDGRQEILRVTDVPLDQFPFKAVNFYVYLDPDHNGIPALFYPRVHLVRNLPDVRFEFASHNAITVRGDEQILLRECVILHHQKPKKRAEREIQRVEMNIPNLAAQGEDQHLENNASARGLFYLGNTLLDSGDRDGAIKAFEDYLSASTWHDERYQAYVHLCSAYMIGGEWGKAEETMKKGMLEPGQWARAEGYMILSDCALSKGETQEAIHWINTAISCRPMTSGLFLQGHLYTWFPHWRLAMIYDRIGCYRESLYHAQMTSQWKPDDYVFETIQIQANRIAELEARKIEVEPYDKVGDTVQLYPVSERSAMERLGVK